MKILYFSDEYAHGVMGTKRSLAERMQAIGHKVILVHRLQIGDVLALVREHHPDQIWLAHSSLTLPPGAKQRIQIPVIGFGFSDPYYFTEDRLASYDAYITNHFETFLKCSAQLPAAYNPTACDLRFHHRMELEKSIDISLIGIGLHPRFGNGQERIETVARLRRELPFRIHVYGRDWPTDHADNHPPVEGEAFLEIINRSKLGLDLQDDFSPLAHRMFEYAGCGVPVITRERPEVCRVFDVGREILTYNDFTELKRTIVRYLSNPAALVEIGARARSRCEREHDIAHRTEGILEFLGSFAVVPELLS